MLLQFTVENFMSIKNKCVFDLTPNFDKEAVITFRDKVFKTKTGTDTLNTMFDI